MICISMHNNVASYTYCRAVLVFLFLCTSPSAGQPPYEVPMQPPQEVPNRKIDLDPNHNPTLDINSVVLITGAAGFLGSELALTLHNIYQVKKVVCIDSLGDAESDLASREFKRQRVFRLLQQAAQNVFFYRVDFRPSVPEFFDSSEVPILHHIFEEHPDISHVVHLAQDEQSEYMIVSRKKRDHEKAGMMEALLEELLLQRHEYNKQVQFIYASSHDVYNHRTDFFNNPNPPPFSENLPLTTTSTFQGASKLTDEMLAQAYYEAHDIASIGLRFFEVYGPWAPPGSIVFAMAEQAVLKANPATSVDDLEAIKDFVFIDDAVDAMLSALQVSNHQAIAVNVGSGVGTSLRHMASLLQRPLGTDHDGLLNDERGKQPRTISYANMSLASAVLGFTTQVTLNDGVQRTFSWHVDRAFPYGGYSGDFDFSFCNKYDAECLRGTPIFHCASECSNILQCKTSLYDDVLALTQAVTSACDTVLYTVSLDTALREIPSTHVRVSTNSIAFVESPGPASHCNLAFIAESSPLYQNLARMNTTPDGVVRHGFWSLIPVYVATFIQNHDRAVLELLPKWSPGKFFAPSVRKAIFVEPNVIVDNIPRLLEESNLQPEHESAHGATALLMGKKKVTRQRDFNQKATTKPLSPAILAQETAYRMIRMAVIDEIMGDGFGLNLDTGVLVHTLLSKKDADLRLFRCDVFAEVVQWKVNRDETALEFILSLHDMWSRVVIQNSGLEPWWIGEDVTTVVGSTISRSRRTQEKFDPAFYENDINIKSSIKKQEVLTHQQDDGGAAKIHVPTNDNQVEETVESSKNHDTKRASDEHNGFGVVQGAIETVLGFARIIDSANNIPLQRLTRPNDEEEDADDFVVDDDDNTGLETSIVKDGVESPPYFPTDEQDPSDIDVWMGILSSSSLQYFGRIVSFEAVGIFRVTDEVDTDEF